MIALAPIARLFPAWAWAVLGGVLASILIGTACYHSGRAVGARDVEARVMADNLAAMTRDAAAKEAASAERVADTLKTAQLTEELNRAIENLPDATPSDRRRALACARLRAQGTDTAALPECR